ncbi:MAG: tetratricopeptide repeat protein [Armatimonadota bacterium]
MHSPRHRQLSGSNPIPWLAQAISAVRRVYARGAARFGLGKKPISAELYFDSDKFSFAVSLIPQERWDSFFDRERPGESQQDREYSLWRRAMLEESETLKQIRDSAGEDTEKAIAEYQQYVSEHPGSDLALRYLGSAFEKAGRFEESLAVFRQTLRRKRGAGKFSHALTHLSIGNVLTKMGRLDDAVMQYRIPLGDTEDSKLSRACYAPLYLSLGDALKLQGKRWQARRAWKQAVKLDQTRSMEAEVAKRLKEQFSWF